MKTGPKNMSTEKFKEKVSLIKNNVEVLSEYKGRYEQVAFKCKNCRHEWSAQAKSMLSGASGCRKCAGSYSYSNEEFLERLKKVNENIEPLSEYVKSNQKIKLRCLICLHEWETTPNKLLSSKTGCPKCAGQVSMSQQEFIDKMKKINSNIVVEGNFKGVDSKIELFCKLCGCEWKTTPSHLFKGTGCPNCFKEKVKNKITKTQEKFEYDLKMVNPSISIKEDYKNSKTKILCECKICKNSWKATPANLLKGRGCPVCTSSKGERIIQSFLKDSKINFVSQKKFENCKDVRSLPFDFYLPDFLVCIEFDGEQHRKPV